MSEAETRRAQSGALHARVQAFMRAGAAEQTTASFDEIACAIARFQMEHCRPIARLAKARGLGGETLEVAAQIPAVPTDVFKLTRVAAHPPDEDTHVFRTSGTTIGRDQRGEHAFRDIATYRLGAALHGHRMLCPDWPRAPSTTARTAQVAILGPSPERVPDSSLGFMCGEFGAIFGASARTYLHDDKLDRAALSADIDAARAAGAPMLVLGTSFAFVYLLDELGSGTLALPEGSRVMQTGGFKGKTRVVEAPALLEAMARAFAIDPRRIVSEYGMTELSSQAYETTLRDRLVPPAATTKAWREGQPRLHAPPAWMRVVAVDGVSLKPVAAGEVGLARVVDLANVDSAVAIQTQDRIRVAEDGVSFELLGRAEGAPPRGCSLATEEMLGTG